MLFPMSTISKKLISFVQCGPLLRPHDVVYLCQAKTTDLGCGVVGGALATMSQVMVCGTFTSLSISDN